MTKKLIDAFIVPWILGINGSPEDINQQHFINDDSNIRKKNDPSEIYSPENLNQELSELLEEDVYTPKATYDEIYNVQINDSLGIYVLPRGVTEHSIILKERFPNKKYFDHTEVIFILLTSMAIWKKRKGFFFYGDQKIELDFDEDYWNFILEQLRDWAISNP